ncbi:MAG: class I SAM-dependent methyltransferase [Dehalococcoidales bacterium]|nr:class I SAM-dependent methyltransferase [Dehalococcoidales bacterium]
MKLRHAIVERLAYLLFGNNLVVGLHIKKQLEFLREHIPPGFQHRKMDDLGCGDGKITIRLKDIFLPESLRCFDINPGLVRRTGKKGFCAEVMNLEQDFPSGELAVMWGSLHHLQDMAGCLDKLRQNYKMVFIREPLKEAGVSWLELGHPTSKGDVESLVSKHLPGARILFQNNAAFIFYESQPEQQQGNGGKVQN